MIEIRKAQIKDEKYFDVPKTHISYEDLKKKIEDGMIYIALADGKIVGWLRYGLFWDQIPFMNHLFFIESFRRRGYGTKLVTFWEKEMYEKGYKLAMTSTQIDEEGQHFYRKLGYKDIGGFTFPDQPLELIMLKTLGE